MKRIDYRHYIFIAITLGFLALAVFVFPTGINRIIEGGRDFGLSIAYYFMEIFELEHSIVPMVNTLPEVYSEPFLKIAETFEQFQVDWNLYWARWATVENVQAYFEFLGDFLYKFSKILLIIVPFILLFVILIMRYFKEENNDYDIDSVPLRIWKVIEKKVFFPVKNWIVELICFFNSKSIYKKLWLLIWAYNFNVMAIVLEFLAFYYYFVVSFDVISIYIQVYKLIVDLTPAVVFIPVWVWVLVGLYFFDRFRKQVGISILNHLERRNRGFINERPIVLMVCGTMGKKKTTMITDMGLSQEVMFRDKAFEKLFENDLKFPKFPWINLENEIKRGMEEHQIYNLATTRKFIEEKQALWEKSPCREYIFNYDFENHPMYYDDKLKVVGIWEVLKTYAQLYFIYVIESSLIISNYSVRTDNDKFDLGNFPIWSTDFFQKSSFAVADSRHSHVLDFDTLRLGKKVIANNRNSDGFEFGVVLITEIGKERGNALELQEKKKNADGANQKNDLFNSWLKMVRHSATVDNFPFVRVITDEQRPESWGADARDLCEIVHIRESGEMRLAMPFFTLGELLYEWVFSKFQNLYYQYRHVRGDNTLLMYMLKGITSGIEHYYKGIYNRFSTCTLRVQIESGTQDGAIKENKYFLSSKKIYSDRFCTDCFSDFFVEKALRADVGIDDLNEYQDTKASFEELKAQNSYFVNELVQGFKRDNDEKTGKGKRGPSSA